MSSNPPTNRRLVAIGRIRAPYRTIDLTVSFREPLWKPQIAPNGESIVDYDLIRKIDLETREDDPNVVH